MLKPTARAAEHVIPLDAGDERSVAATKTYTASLAAIAALAAASSGDERLSQQAERRGAPSIVASMDGAAAIRLVPQPDWLSPLGAAVAAQLLAAGRAERRGIEVDRPFGLSKITKTT